MEKMKISMVAPNLRLVIDTNVIFEGLTQQGGAAGLIVEAWLAGSFEVYVFDTLAYEYAEVLSRKLSTQRWQRVAPLLEALLKQSQWVTIHYSWRPTSPDPGDDHVIDCAMNANAAVITSNRKDFEMAKKTLGLTVMTLTELVKPLTRQPF